MKKSGYLALLLLPVLMIGCSSDDDVDKPNGPTGPPRVVSYETATVPSLSNPNDPIWDSATAVTVAISQVPLSPAAPGRSERSIARSVPANVSVKAITQNDTLYLQVVWTDVTFDARPDPFVLISFDEGLPLFAHDEAASEDQLILLFDGMTDDRDDVWHWRVLTTTALENGSGYWEGFAEGKSLLNNTLTLDQGSVVCAFSNPSPGGFNQPQYMHEDSSDFTGYILYLDASVNYRSTSGGWTVGQYIPGYRTDSSIAGSTKDPYRQSRWDVRAVSEWSDGTDQYTVVLCGAMDTGYDDDLVMADSVSVRVGITDKLDFDFGIGSNRQGFTSAFWIIF